MTIEIVKNIPAPDSTFKYPLANMEIGDSFFSTDNRARLVNTVSYYGRKHGKKFVTRKENDGTRIWRRV